MKYKCTLIKDLPEYPKGTVFYYTKYPDSDKIYMMVEGEANTCVYPHRLEYIIRHTKWYTREVVQGCLTMVSCPNCGNTQVSLRLCNEKSEWDDGVRYYSKEMTAECPCGNVYSLGRFGTYNECGR